MGRTPKRNDRLQHGAAREKIFSAAELLFSESSPESVSFREIAAKAGVTLSAIHYHFGSKENILREIFERRAAPMVQKRMEGASRLVDEGRDREVAALLDAFVRPAFDFTDDDQEHLFNKLRGRLAVSSMPYAIEVIAGEFEESDLRYIELLSAALPQLSKKDVYWRFHLFVGAMIYTMSDNGQLERLSQGECSLGDIETTINELVTSFTNVFCSPSQS